MITELPTAPEVGFRALMLGVATRPEVLPLPFVEFPHPYSVSAMTTMPMDLSNTFANWLIYRPPLKVRSATAVRSY
jgi:hypothetical protein